MLDLTSNTYIIIYFIKSFIMNMFIYYSFNKISGINYNGKKILIAFSAFNLLLSVLYTYMENSINTIMSLLILSLINGIILGILTKNKIGYSLVVTIISCAICNIALVLSAVINFLPYRLIYKGNDYLNLVSVVLVQGALLYFFFKAKRFSKGFAFIKDKLNNDITEVIVGFVSISVVLIKAIMGTLYLGYKAATQDMFIIFVLLGITMFIVIQRTLTIHYKQTQLLKTMKEYENELSEKDKEIEKLSKEKFNTSKIRHEFYNRQKALELLVKQNISLENNMINKNTSENILNIIDTLSNEYSKECEKLKQLPELDKTDIIEIDSMFKYMQNECYNNNIEFKLRIIGNIYPLVNNVIPKSKLETLIGDHIKDAINAINNIGIVNKEILVIIGKKDKKYELTIHDTGVEFEIDTLLKLGKEATTTCAAKGGSGIGFLTTFETLKETKASLIITENKPTNNRYYTKSISIRFDGKHEYKINSYRAEEIASNNTDNNIKIEKIK